MVERALRGNPDLFLARVEEQRATLAIGVAKDPFRPKAFVGSGLAYSSGFPMSIEGSAPSIVQARAVSSFFNRPASYRVAQSSEQARTAGVVTQQRRDEVVFQATALFLEAARWTRTADAIRPQIAPLERAEQTVRARVTEGRELEIEAKRAALAVARTRHRLAQIEQERDYAEATLAVAIGLPPADRVRPASLETLNLSLPDTEEAALQQAVEQSRELRRLESALLAKRHELRAYQSARLPTIDLVAQYGLFARFNNYEDFFQRFQRHNGQLGISVQLPVFASAASLAQAGQAEAELSGLRSQIAHTRSRIAASTQNVFRQVALAGQTRDLARQDLELAREQVNILLAQADEGRVALRQVEEARFLEQEKWILYFDAQSAAERARVQLLNATGALLAAVQ